MKLVIVESPTKCKTIAKYLGDEYNVLASEGHVRDLATSGKGGLGVDVENNFKPTYKISKSKYKIVNELRKATKKADEVILATDPDREGEAISWHLAEVLGLDITKTKRLEFHEITKDAIDEAINNPRTIDMNIVSSQETRRIIDRIIGFKLSNIMQQKINAKSAGRVQSATLKFICDHENVINNFVKEEYWTLDAFININNKEIKLPFIEYNGKPYELTNEDLVNELINKVDNKLIVSDLKRTIRKVEIKEPFTTSTLQQEANNRFKFSASKISSLAQKLYEGVSINGELVGLITYIRTDISRLSDTYIAKAKKYISETYGQEYFTGVKKGVKNKSKIQGAHEAIRPTSNRRTPESVKPFLSSDEYKLYELIYNRTLASLMPAKKIEVKTLILSSNGVSFKLDSNKTIYDGYSILNKKNDDEKNEVNVGDFNIGDEINIVKLEKEQHFTNPPSRLSEAKIIGLMEEKGVGRPSTYATTIKTITDKNRKYVEMEKGLAIPTEMGIKLSHVLDKYFSEFVNYKYTASMEEQLDRIQMNEITSLEVLSNFYEKFIRLVKDGYEKIYKDQYGTCPICNSPLFERKSRYGTFIACSNYPSCSYVKPREKEPEKVVEGRVCPKCGNILVYKKDKKGKEYIICKNYNQCKYSESNNVGKKSESTPVISDKKCPKCGADLLIRTVSKGKNKGKQFLGCSKFPKCKYIEDLK